MTVERVDEAEIEARRVRFWARVDATVKDRKDGYALMPFQKDGIDWLGRRPRAILADDMGLGKTVQALAAVAGAEAFPCLVITRSTLKGMWESQIAQWTGMTSYVMNTGARSAAIRAQKTLPRKFFVSHYEGVRAEAEKLREIEWKSIIIDEATDIKNRSAQRTKAVKSIRAPRIILLSGTPLLNSPLDLWSLLNEINPAAWPSYYKFEKRYAIMGGWMGKQVIGYRNVPELTMALQSVMLRRRKDEVLKDLPPKTYSDVWLELPAWQRKFYEIVKTEVLIEIAKDKTLTVATALAKLTRLKQAATWPQVQLGLDAKEMPVKLDALLEILEERAGKKTLVFSKSAKVIDAAVKLVKVKRPGAEVFALTGQTPQDQRQPRVDAFQTSSREAIWFATIDAGGMGLTLTAADTVVFLDKDFRPKINEQAEDRAHRIGQKGNVQVISLIAKDTIEEHIERILDKKRDLFDAIVEKDGGFKAERITMEDLKELWS